MLSAAPSASALVLCRRSLQFPGWVPRMQNVLIGGVKNEICIHLSHWVFADRSLSGGLSYTSSSLHFRGETPIRDFFHMHLSHCALKRKKNIFLNESLQKDCFQGCLSYVSSSLNHRRGNPFQGCLSYTSVSLNLNFHEDIPFRDVSFFHLYLPHSIFQERLLSTTYFIYIFLLDIHRHGGLVVKASTS